MVIYFNLLITQKVYTVKTPLDVKQLLMTPGTTA